MAETVKLGELESATMQVLWHGEEPMTVRQVLAALEGERPLAYTTVLTVLDNLHTKQMVLRERQGRAYLYRPAMSRSEFGAAMIRDVLQVTGDPESVLLHFASSASAEESRFLRRAARRLTGRGERSVP